MEYWQGIDQWLFHLINIDLSNSWMDQICPWMRHAKNWIPFYLIITVWIIYQWKWKGFLIILLAAGAVGFSDFTCSELFKKQIQRPRPCHQWTQSTDIILRAPCGSGYSMPSIHASNHMVLATVFATSIFRRKKFLQVLFYLWALCIGFSQIYVGLHFFSDVLIGACYGFIVGMVFGNIINRFILNKNQSGQLSNV